MRITFELPDDWDEARAYVAGQDLACNGPVGDAGILFMKYMEQVNPAYLSTAEERR